MSAVQRSRVRVGVRVVRDPVTDERRAVVQSRGDWVTLLVDNRPVVSAQLVLSVTDCMAEGTINESFVANRFSWELPGGQRAMPAEQFSAHMAAITDMDANAALVYARSVGLVTT